MPFVRRKQEGGVDSSSTASSGRSTGHDQSRASSGASAARGGAAHGRPGAAPPVGQFSYTQTAVRPPFVLSSFIRSSFLMR